jgi:hypothetical protein
MKAVPTATAAGCSSPSAPAPAPPSATQRREPRLGHRCRHHHAERAGNLFVCAMNPNEANPSIRQQALAFFGGSLTSDEDATLYDAFAYYLDAIGAI